VASSAQVRTDQSNRANLARGVVAGVIAGAIAAFVMDWFQAVVSPLFLPNGDASEPATEKAADAIAKSATGRAVPDADKPLTGQTIHYTLGIALGAAYGIAAELRPSITKGDGLLFGLGTATLLDEGAVPAAGLGSPPWNAGLVSNLYSYTSHLVFGAVSEIVRRQVAGTLVPRPNG
jgi:putative membrane protein